MLDKLLKPGQALAGAQLCPSTVVRAPEVPVELGTASGLVLPQLHQVPNLLFYLGLGWVLSEEQRMFFFSPVVTGGT